MLNIRNVVTGKQGGKDPRSLHAGTSFTSRAGGCSGLVQREAARATARATP